MRLILIFSLLPLLVGCYKEEEYDITKYNVDDVILKIETDSSSMLADGSSTTMLRVFLPEDAVEDLSEVKITLSNGLFVENELNEITTKPSLWTITENSVTTVQNYAEHEIQSSVSVGAIEIEVEVQRLVKTHRVTLNINPITAIKVTPSSLIISPYTFEEVSVVCNAESTSGTPSEGQKINLNALDSLFSPIGTFRTYQDETDESGQTTSSFTMLPDTSYKGKVYFIGDAPSSGSKDTTIIYSI